MLLMHMKEKESERREVCESSSHDKFERYVDVTLRDIVVALT